MKNITKTVLLVLLLLLTLAACGSKDEAVEETAVPDLVQPTQPAAAVGDTALTAQAWQWVSFLDQVEGEINITDPQNYTVAFQTDGSVQVKADCNNASGTYAANAGNMSIVLGATTMVACAPESRGNDFLNYLGGAALYHIENGRLSIDLIADSGTMTFISINATVPTAEPPTGNPTAVPPTAVAPTTAPPTQPTTAPPIYNTPVPPPPGSVVDGGARDHAQGTYAAPYYTVAAGDTLYSIGLRFNITTYQITAVNNMSNGLLVGQTLLIPSANMSPTPVPPPATGTERVSFAQGTSSSSLSRTIDQGQPKSFVLGGGAGQIMRITTRSSAEYLMITVHDTNGNSMPISGINGQANNDVSMSLPYSGDYVVIITPTTPPESPSMNFDITFSIP